MNILFLIICIIFNKIFRNILVIISYFLVIINYKAVTIFINYIFPILCYLFLKLEVIKILSFLFLFRIGICSYCKNQKYYNYGIQNISLNF